ncbi:MAG: divalent-cation tolerance protein CutA [Verrucomicrobiota bacterium JB023]|nr:divalent-cation tolerance protein CutA [Verrucomicrobiota bacterium JB023]
MTEVLVMVTTFPSESQARAISRELVKEGLIACANILPGAVSVYQWEGEICEDAEVVVLMKTLRSRYAEVEASLRQRHPYEVPEILALDVRQGLPAYLEFVGENCRDEA